MSIRVLRRGAPAREARVGEGARWLFEGRDFWAVESAPILVASKNDAERSKFLAQDLAISAQEFGGGVLVIFSPEEEPGSMLDALGEALRALFPELKLDSPKGSELMRWASAVDRATKGSRVDSKRRLLIVDSFEAIWKGLSEERAQFAETLRCLARQRSLAVVASIAEDRLADCAELPGFSHAYRDLNLVPIVRRHF